MQRLKKAAIILLSLSFVFALLFSYFRINILGDIALEVLHSNSVATELYKVKYNRSGDLYSAEKLGILLSTTNPADSLSYLNKVVNNEKYLNSRKEDDIELIKSTYLYVLFENRQMEQLIGFYKKTISSFSDTFEARLSFIGMLVEPNLDKKYYEFALEECKSLLNSEEENKVPVLLAMTILYERLGDKESVLQCKREIEYYREKNKN